MKRIIYCIVSVLTFAVIGDVASYAQKASGTDTLVPGMTLNDSKEISFKETARAMYEKSVTMDLTDVWGFSFNLEIPSDIPVIAASLYLKSVRGDESGWYKYSLDIDGPDGLTAIDAKHPSTTEGSPAGFDAIVAIRIRFRIADASKGHPFIIGIKNLGLEPTKPETAQRFTPERNALALSVPSRAGERRLAWSASPKDSKFDWDAFVGHAAAVGITDLIPNLSNNYRAFYPSKYLPYKEDDCEHLDKYIAACHKYGIKAHVWKVQWRCRNFKTIDADPILSKWREEGRFGVTYSGSKFEESPWLCPSDDRNFKLEYDAMVELASKGVDGINFDYIRHQGRSSCYCDRCRKKFEKQLGRKVENWPEDCYNENGPLAKEWDDFRASQISRLVEAVSKYVRKHYPKVEVSASIQSYPACTAAAQRWEEWCLNGWVDFVCPMDYSQSVREFEAKLPLQKKICDKSGVGVYPGIGIHSSRSLLDALDCARQIEVVREAGFPGYSFFSIKEKTFPVFDVLAKGPMGKK